LGFDLMLNFHVPYFCRSPGEYWQRWHISLSSWMRDYVFFPLGGSRNGQFNAYRNTMITLALSGLWHGAAWNFVLWGVLQGIMLCIQRAIVQIRRALGWYHPDRPLPVWRLCAGILFFFIVTCFAKMIFRARSVEQIVDYTLILFTQFGDFSLSISRPTLAALVGMPLLFLCDLQQYRTDNPQWYLSMPPSVRGLQYASVVFILLLGLSNAPAQFIYFQF
jgi:D-alanyl-lipoteichoic acid acyltransferase DltB (MBOAT superfamily)